MALKAASRQEVALARLLSVCGLSSPQHLVLDTVTQVNTLRSLGSELCWGIGVT